MKTRKILYICLIPLTLVLPNYASDVNEPSLTPYLDQKPPGMVPEIFAPGIICLKNRYEQFSTFTPDVNEFCFTITNSGWSWCSAWHVKKEQGQWTEPKQPGFIGSGDVWCVHYSPNGEGLYFVSSRPNYPPTNIWMCEKTATGWNAPVRLNLPVSSSSDEWGFSLTSDKSIFFCSHRAGGSGGCDVWWCQYENGRYLPAENISILNTNSNDCAPHVSPDKSFLVFNSNKPGGYGSADLYISFRQEDDSWTAPKNLGPSINTPDAEMAFSLSPDLKYCFFTRRTNNDSDIYWVDARAILPEPNGPILNLETGQRFATIQAAVNYAESGQTIMLLPGEYKENIVLPAKEITISSENVRNSAVVSKTTISGSINSPVLTILPGSTIKLQGLTIHDGATGISCSQAQLQMNHCVVKSNLGCGIEVGDESNLEMNNCIVVCNKETGLCSLPKSAGRKGNVYSNVRITNCTFAQNHKYAIDGDEIEVVNSILYFNGELVDGAQVIGENLNITFSDIQGGCPGQGNIDINPEFVKICTQTDPNIPCNTDYHLKSTAGHWNPIESTWVMDQIISPCIDAGNPNDPVDSEQAENGNIINMGAYGGTQEASRTNIPEQIEKQTLCGCCSGLTAPKNNK